MKKYNHKSCSISKIISSIRKQIYNISKLNIVKTMSVTRILYKNCSHVYSLNSKCKQVNKYVNRKRIFKNYTRYEKF